MRTREEMKKELKRWMIKNQGMSGARVLIAMSRSGKYSDDEIELYTLDDLNEVASHVKEEVLNAERFERACEIIEAINASKESYENGLITLPTFNSQVDFHIIKYGKEFPRVSKCYTCGQVHTGTLQFVCDNCEQFT